MTHIDKCLKKYQKTVVCIQQIFNEAQTCQKQYCMTHYIFKPIQI